MCRGYDLPPRPEQMYCLANGTGGGGCYDYREHPSKFIKPNIKNYVCYDPHENQAHEEWIQQVIDACKGN